MVKISLLDKLLMIAEFPEIEILHYHGPYLSEPSTSVPAIVMGQAAYWDKYVWYYSLEDDWLVPGRMPEAWIDIVEEIHDLINK